jgi:hypothetical protein
VKNLWFSDWLFALSTTTKNGFDENLRKISILYFISILRARSIDGKKSEEVDPN